MKTRCVIITPISGVEDSEKGDIFDRLISDCSKHTKSLPIVVLDSKTRWWGKDGKIRKLAGEKKIVLVECLCVDTCQMWLEGWNHVFSSQDVEDVDRIVLLPGDLVQIADTKEFFHNLEHFVKATSPDMLLGQFKVKKASGKALIDQYGVYPLLANWFPKVSKLIHGEGIERPRSEFLNMDARRLKKLLEKRSFAYEQTLNMIIRIVETPKEVDLDPPNGDPMDSWFHSHVQIMNLGEVSDDSSARAFSGCIDQIERTDRLLRFMWRELNLPPEPLPTEPDEKYREFLKEFSLLARTSSEVRHAAVVAIRALLGT